ncbi:hypothetical protein STCU_01005 [Strigomonas culicis]|uniref:Uncharacterized protein n=1 Tax=Strigomonas culicis TaxID=28005 RepID=S9V3S1_9TRYP|nr:hypothetical protein STCU_01005 [Strigomonas culicis]|eukprot:EPY35669.1 hypothetical protein STCU_01005 [Strigomonas culicis]
MRRVCAVTMAAAAAARGGLHRVPLAAPRALCVPARALASLVGAPTAIRRFDLKKHEMEKRRLRELEKAGIDPDDDEPWVAPEEQARLDDEEAARQAEEEARLRAYLAKRDEEDAKKREKFKQFRARQVAMSKQRKKANAERKVERTAQRGGDEEVEEENSDVTAEPLQEGPPMK